jgi:hypothetical protein
MSTPWKTRIAIRIINRLRGKHLLGDERGDVLVGFILIVGLLFSLFFAGVGFFLLLSWLQFTEMATQAGVRTAVVSSPAVNWPEEERWNEATSAGLLGQSCSHASKPCKTLTTRACTGTTCTGAGYAHIAARMRQIFPLIEDKNIRITYADSGLGYVGGPPVPLVTVEVVNLEIPVIGAIIDLALRLVGGAAGNPATMRTIAASMTAEDLNTAGSP